MRVLDTDTSWVEGYEAAIETLNRWQAENPRATAWLESAAAAPQLKGLNLFDHLIMPVSEPRHAVRVVPHARLWPLSRRFSACRAGCSCCVTSMHARRRHIQTLR